MANAVYVLAAHGSHAPLAQAVITSLTTAISRRRPDIDFHTAYVNVQSPTPEETVRALATRAGTGGHITVVPVLLSTGYHVRVDLRRAAELAPGARVAAPLGPDPRVIEVLRARLIEAGLEPPPDPRPDASPAASPADNAAAHGHAHAAANLADNASARAGEIEVTLSDAGSRDPAAARDVAAAAAALGARLNRRVASSHVAGIDPRTSDIVAQAHRQGRQVAVASYLLTPGHFAAQQRASNAQIVAEPLLPAACADAVDLVPAQIVSVILDRAGLADAAALESARSLARS